MAECESYNKRNTKTEDIQITIFEWNKSAGSKSVHSNRDTMFEIVLLFPIQIVFYELRPRKRRGWNQRKTTFFHRRKNIHRMEKTLIAIWLYYPTLNRTHEAFVYNGIFSAKITALIFSTLASHSTYSTYVRMAKCAIYKFNVMMYSALDNTCVNGYHGKMSGLRISSDSWVKCLLNSKFVVKHFSW